MKKYFAFGILGILIILSFVSPHLMFNSGELIEEHQTIENKCFSCHVAFHSTPNEKCITCHKLEEIGLDTSKTSQQQISNNFHIGVKNLNCTDCHTDHKGKTPSKSLQQFNHSILEAAVLNNCITCHNAPINNLHQVVGTNCVSCHNTKSWQNVAAFDHTTLNETIKSNCISCHQQPNDNLHNNYNTNISCATCHNTQKWKPADFDHNNYFILDKQHNVTCNTCHTGNNFKTYTCYGCHEHTINNIREEHEEEGIYQFTNCVNCHKSSNEHDIQIPEYLKKTNKGGEQKRNHDENEEDDD
jgi:hypothetical protein